MLRALNRRPHEQQLVRRVLAVVQVAAGEPVPGFEIGRREHLARDQSIGEARAKNWSITQW